MKDYSKAQYALSLDPEDIPKIDQLEEMKKERKQKNKTLSLKEDKPLFVRLTEALENRPRWNKDGLRWEVGGLYYVGFRGSERINRFLEEIAGLVAELKKQLSELHLLISGTDNQFLVKTLIETQILGRNKP